MYLCKLQPHELDDLLLVPLVLSDKSVTIEGGTNVAYTWTRSRSLKE